ncbi:MAG TPA: terminase small subunit, partial [Spirochaetota bacterium]|nr:terminase small subunit [Spirochaetota bacterium]
MKEEKKEELVEERKTVDKDLTNKEEKFIEYYIQTYNGTLAIKKAGYDVANDQVASVMAYENLRKPHIIEAIRNRTQRDNVRLKLTTDEILELMTKIALGEERDMIVVTHKDKVIKKQIKAQLKDRLKAIELLGRANAMFTDKIATDIKPESFV